MTTVSTVAEREQTVYVPGWVCRPVIYTNEQGLCKGVGGDRTKKRKMKRVGLRERGKKQRHGRMKKKEYEQALLLNCRHTHTQCYSAEMCTESKSNKKCINLSSPVKKIRLQS